jgi:hypothetical protein
MEWLRDDKGNKCSVEYFGSKEAAQKALDSLKNCDNCINCSYCSRLEGKKENKKEKPEIRNTIPVIENIHQRIYEAARQPNALKMDSWHTCEKTHCRAGWAVTLAGDAGKKLESFFNTELAAMMICHTRPAEGV